MWDRAGRLELGGAVINQNAREEVFSSLYQAQTFLPRQSMDANVWVR